MQTVRALLLCTYAFTLTALLAGCGANSVPVSSNNNTGTGPVPTVTAQAVEVNGVAPNRKQEVQFSEAMDPGTLNNKTFIITDAGGNPVPGDVSYDSTFNTAIFQPTPALETGTAYTATIRLAPHQRAACIWRRPMPTPLRHAPTRTARR